MATVDITQPERVSDSGLPESEILYEIVNGLRVKCPPMGVSDNLIAAEIQDARTKAVWVVYPSQTNVYCYDSVTEVRVIDRNGIIDGGGLLSGLSVTIESLFATLKKPRS